ncbi:PALB protein [Xylona heveae TC161]|uniref:PALB protein n=1 Tax=Xylona heveae (strain CBS 132557 / TC161) TaxID=1328760 RepID=A0A161TFZ7_XYLHT|nr:PALB protein [Xylona heveae TC161]KZF25017.1 PALB protein [Xylona heveae TC161]
MTSRERLTELETRASDTESLIAIASTRDDALNAAIKAAELYMQAMKQLPAGEKKARLKQKCNGLLDQAEKIKSCADWQGQMNSAATVAKLDAPSSTRVLATKEKRILLEDSKLNGFIFPPWNASPDPHEFILKEGEPLYTDIPELGLSDSQRDAFDGWKRPAEALPPKHLFKHSDETSAQHEPTMKADNIVDLVQDITTDCSVVASLCAGTARAERGHAKIISSILFPYDMREMRPAISPNGKYIFRLHFNGCSRKVVIDDRLPTSRTSRVLYVIDRRNPCLLWPALIEKAYLKVRGGYDFPGSNSGTDIWVLTGWIPEQVFLQSEEVVPNRLWNRMLQSFKYGDVLITMGTGKLSRREEKSLGLSGQHDYAVLDLKEVGNRRLFLVKNPWSEGTTWKGRVPESEDPKFEPDDDESSTWTSHLRDALPEGELAPGTFWIDLNNVMQTFESIYLNWNPGLFLHREDFHFSWDLSTLRSVPGCFNANPQYSITSRAGGVVWVLLDRHFKTGESKATSSAAPTATATTDDTHSTGKGNAQGFISLYAFHRNTGQRVVLSDGADQRGPYVDSPQTLMRLEMPPQSSYTLVVSEQDLPPSLFNFTISAFSRTRISMTPAAEKYPFTSTHQSSWTATSAGGNADCSLYPTNPQFSITLPSRTAISLLLETPNTDIPVHIKLVWAGGNRLTSLTSRDILGDSVEYRRGCALAELPPVEAGTYTIICSTFSPGQLAPFTLRIGTNVACRVQPIPPEWAGRLRITLPPARFPSQVNSVYALLTPQRLTRLRVIARYPPNAAAAAAPATRARTPVRVRLESGRGPNSRCLAESNAGEFADTLMGIRTPDVDVLPDMQWRGGVWLVVERLGGPASLEDRMDVEILTESVVSVGEWLLGD